MIAIRLERRLLVGLLFSAVAAAFACGGSQRMDRDAVASACGDVDASMTSSDLETAAACHRREATDGNAAACREAVELGDVASATTLRDFAHCVMQVRDRSDGVWLADMMYAVRNDGIKLAAVTSVFSETFDVAAHGVTWTSSVDTETQEALGAVLGRLDAPTREAIISLALAYRLQPLATLAAPYVTELDGSDPGVATYAEQLAESGEPLDENERRVLLTTGTWTAQDALDCYERSNAGCTEWAGISPLEMLAELTPDNIDPGFASTPGNALRALRQPDIDPASARGIAIFIGGAEYANRETMLNGLMLDLTSASTRPEIRLAIADASTAPMCDYDRLGDYVLRARTSDPDRFENPDAAWPTFVKNCAERQWSVEDRFAAAGAGSWLGVPFAFGADIRTTLVEELGESSCDELRALGAAAVERTPWVITRGMSDVVAATVGGERCAPLFTEAVSDRYEDRGEHPEVRIAALQWLIAQGEESCRETRNLDDILDWRHPEYGDDAGPWAEAFAAEIRTACE